MSQYVDGLIPHGWTDEDADLSATTFDWNNALRQLNNFLDNDSLKMPFNEGKQMDDAILQRTLVERVENATNDIDMKLLALTSNVIKEYPKHINILIKTFKKLINSSYSNQQLQTACSNLLDCSVNPTLVCVALMNVMFDARLQSEK